MSAGAIIEFVGLPGSGKSVAAGMMSEALRQDGRAVRQRTVWQIRKSGPGIIIALRKLLAVTASITRWPRDAVAALAMIAASRQRSWIDALKCASNALEVRGLLAGAGRDTVILDQGVWQAGWSVGFAARGPCAGRIRRWAQRLSADSRVVLVEAPLATALARLAARSGRESRLEDGSRNGPQRALVAWRLVDTGMERHRHVIRLNNSGDLDNLRRQIESATRAIIT